jgi:transcriptional regulator with XRE-family HTH domain
MSMIEPCLASHLREWRRYRHLTQGTLAQRAGLSESLVSMIEINRRAPNTNDLVLLTQALGCTPNDLLYDTPATMQVMQENALCPD